jgi:hypothetical protein
VLVTHFLAENWFGMLVLEAVLAASAVLGLDSTRFRACRPVVGRPRCPVYLRVTATLKLSIRCRRRWWCFQSVHHVEPEGMAVSSQAESILGIFQKYCLGCLHPRKLDTQRRGLSLSPRVQVFFLGWTVRCLHVQIVHGMERFELMEQFLELMENNSDF